MYNHTQPCLLQNPYKITPTTIATYMLAAAVHILHGCAGVGGALYLLHFH